MKINFQTLLRSKTPFQRMLSLFLRVLSIFLFCSGILNWSYLIEIIPYNGIIFSELAVNWKTLIIFLVIVDISAAVGLWLQATWGAVIWIFRTILLVFWSEVIDSTFDLSVLTLTIYVVTITIYFTLRYFANVEIRTTVQRGLGLS